MCEAVIFKLRFEEFPQRLVCKGRPQAQWCGRSTTKSLASARSMPGLAKMSAGWHEPRVLRPRDYLSLLFIVFRGWGERMYHDERMEVRGQLVEVTSLLPPCVFWGIASRSSDLVTNAFTCYLSSTDNEIENKVGKQVHLLSPRKSQQA